MAKSAPPIQPPPQPNDPPSPADKRGPIKKTASLMRNTFTEKNVRQVAGKMDSELRSFGLIHKRAQPFIKILDGLIEAKRLSIIAKYQILEAAQNIQESKRKGTLLRDLKKLSTRYMKIAAVATQRMADALSAKNKKGRNGLQKKRSSLGMTGHDDPIAANNYVFYNGDGGAIAPSGDFGGVSVGDLGEIGTEILTELGGVAFELLGACSELLIHALTYAAINSIPAVLQCLGALLSGLGG